MKSLNIIQKIIIVCLVLLVISTGVFYLINYDREQSTKIVIIHPENMEITPADSVVTIKQDSLK